MRKASFKTSFENFRTEIAKNLEILYKIEDTDDLSIQEKKSLFETLVIRFDVTWQILLEELFIDSLNWDSSEYRKNTGYDFPGKNLHRQICKAIVIGIKFSDFAKLDDVRRNAKEFLVGKFNPFRSIRSQERNKIEEFYTLRNYIAHASDYQLRKLRKMYKDRYRLKKYPSPGTFLLNRNAGQKFSRLQNYVNSFLNAAKQMGKGLKK